MKYIVPLLLLSCLLSTPAFAAQRTRDMSLSVDETMRQPTTTPAQKTQTTPRTGADTGFDESIELDPNMARQLQDLRAREIQDNSKLSLSGNARGEMPADRGFMSNFCNTPADGNALQSCQASQREAACQRFHRATVDIQRLLDRAINCEYTATGSRAGFADCDGLDAGRLDLLKQYWQDEEASYTILFLPDMVLNAAANCKTNTRTGGIPR